MTDTENTEPAEDKARKMGWRPQEDFKGDPERWVDAETFVKNGEERLPLLKDNNRKLEQKIANMEKTFQEFSEYHKKTIEETSKREYDKAKRELKAQQRQAVEEGDTETFDRIEQEIAAIPKPEAPKPETPQQQNADPVVTDWIQENKWFDKDQTLRHFAISIENFLTTAYPGMDQSEVLKEVKDRTQQEFPEKFGNPKRTAPGAVYSGNEPPPVKAGKKTFADLPEDAKAACKRYVDQKLLTKDQYIKSYFGE